MPATTPSDWTTLARILRPQGRKGELLADLLTDFPEKITGDRALYLGTATSHDPTPVQVLSLWLPHGKNEGRVVLQLAGITSIEAAAALAGQELLVASVARVPLADDSVYISELRGCRLLSGGEELGTITDVSFPATPDGRRRLTEAAPLLVVASPAGDEILIPFVRSYIVRLDPAARVLEMKLPEGLTTLNAPAPPGAPPSESAGQADGHDGIDLEKTQVTRKT